MRKITLAAFQLAAVLAALQTAMAAISLTVTPNPAGVRATVTVQGSQSGLPVFGAPTPMGIAFGDGSPDYTGLCYGSTCGLTTTHVYPIVGNYIVTFTGLGGTATVTLRVLGSPPPPPPGPGPVTLAVSPSSFSIPRVGESQKSVVWSLRGDAGLSATAVSDQGRFLAGGETLGTVAASLAMNVAAGSGQVPEFVRLPAAVLAAALDLGLTRVDYWRSFTVIPSGGGSPVTAGAAVTFNITTTAMSDFEIRRLELYFANRRAETTVPRNEPGLAAFADINYAGTGLLEGHWEVDGRNIQPVIIQLGAAGSVSLRTPEIPSLPTFDPGTHVVRFVITSPAIGAVLPAIVYFVTPDESRKRLWPIGRLQPEKGTLWEYAPLKFEWEKPSGGALFLVQYFDDPAGRPVFSALTRESFYLLPKPVFGDVFKPGRKYYWKITGFDAESNAVGESPLLDFSF